MFQGYFAAVVKKSLADPEDQLTAGVDLFPSFQPSQVGRINAGFPGQSVTSHFGLGAEFFRVLAKFMLFLWRAPWL